MYRAHVLLWPLWAMALAVYWFKVAGGRGVDDYVIILAVHVGTFYATARLVDSYMRLLLGAVLVFVLVMAVSVASGALAMNWNPGARLVFRVVNFWEVMFMLYAGMGFGGLYALFRQRGERRKAAEQAAAALQSKLHESEVMKVSSMLIPHLTNNLMSTLTYVTMHNPRDTRMALWLATQIIQFYAALRVDERVSVRDELQVADVFLELQEYELGCRPEIELVVDDELLDKLIIPMLVLLPLENISKYGVLHDAAVAAKISIRSEGRWLIIHAENEIRQQPRKHTVSTQNGLVQLRQKLEHMDVTHTLACKQSDNRYVFHLALKIV